jgi:hemolysin-activating ACP:hemolysin acyltransferase
MSIVWSNCEMVNADWILLARLAREGKIENSALSLAELIFRWSDIQSGQRQKNRSAMQEMSVSHDPELLKLVNVGKSLYALGQCQLFRSLPFVGVWSNVVTSTAIQQAKIYEDARGIPTHFVCWAWLSQYSLERLAENPNLDLHPSEWNEGTALCFRLLSLGAKFNQQLARDISEDLFPEASTIRLSLKSKKTCQSELFVLSAAERRGLQPWIRAQSNP